MTLKEEIARINTQAEQIKETRMEMERDLCEHSALTATGHSVECSTCLTILHTWPARPLPPTWRTRTAIFDSGQARAEHDAAREALAAAWNPPYQYNGD